MFSTLWRVTTMLSFAGWVGMTTGSITQGWFGTKNVILVIYLIKKASQPWREVVWFGGFYGFSRASLLQRLEIQVRPIFLIVTAYTGRGTGTVPFYCSKGGTVPVPRPVNDFEKKPLFLKEYKYSLRVVFESVFNGVKTSSLGEILALNSCDGGHSL